MKKIYSLLVLALLSWTVSSHAQTIELRETQGGSALAPGTNVTVVGYQWNTTQKYIYSVNTSGQTEEVNMTRYELNVQPGTENFYCWGICPASVYQGTNPEWESPVSVFMNPGVEVSNFYGNHVPHGITGTNSYRFTWYLVNDRSDTNSVDITFDIVLSLDEVAKNLKVMAYPNPATDYLQFNFDHESINGHDVVVTLYNMIGEEVASYPVTGDALRADVAEFSRGMYFYTVSINGNQALTKKVVLE